LLAQILVVVLLSAQLSMHDFTSPIWNALLTAVAGIAIVRIRYGGGLASQHRFMSLRIR
jgi:hypothetical protein